MSVNVTDIQDYLTWRQNENAVGVRDMPHDYAQYRERIDQDKRLEDTLRFLSGLIDEAGLLADPAYVIELLTGVEYEPDDV